MQLIINTFGTSLRRKGERLVIKSPSVERRIEISAHKVQSLVIATGVHLSSNVVHLAAEHNIDIVFLDKSGHPTARVWQTKLGSTAAIRRRQLEAADTAEALGFVRGWIGKKINNQLEFLRELEHRRPESKESFVSPLATLAQCADKVAACAGTVDEQRSTLMGLEGAAGRAYFACLGQLMPEEYRFTGRSRQPATDAFNAMLNYSYGVLYSLVERALILAGLDPFVGFLHTDNYNKRSLVFDMIEPFRILGDRTTVLIFTGRRAKREFFREIPGGIELSPEGRPALMESFNKRLDRTVRIQLAQGLMAILLHRFSDKKLVLLGDRGYASHDLAPFATVIALASRWSASSFPIVRSTPLRLCQRSAREADGGGSRKRSSRRLKRSCLAAACARRQSPGTTPRNVRC